ncbi:hypothetical protein V5799_017439 [Amblyomma americanum]|uniref:Uncharacterized protein n=1 Tax=Amblyomma americanum TaxID=6943 RepID=A0AAQ4F381_AMBAM
MLPSRGRHQPPVFVQQRLPPQPCGHRQAEAGRPELTEQMKTPPSSGRLAMALVDTCPHSVPLLSTETEGKIFGPNLWLACCPCWGKVHLLCLQRYHHVDTTGESWLALMPSTRYLERREDEPEIQW